MKRADWLTFIAAIIIVMGIAAVVNLPKMMAPAPSDNSTSGNVTAYVYDTCTDGSCCQPKTHYIYDFHPVVGVKTIRLNNDLNSIYAQGAKGYPRISFPTGMKTSTGDMEPVDDNTYYIRSTGYASSDLFQDTIWGKNLTTQFAVLKDSKSGFSEIFGVPYDLWRIKVTLVPKGNLAYVRMNWVLVDSSTGDVITGGEVLPDNPMLKKVELANRKYYLMIETSNVESYEFSLETPDVLHDQVNIRPEIADLLNFLNTMAE